MQTEKTLIRLGGLLLFHVIRGARWLSGRVSDSGVRGRGFETYRRRVVSLSKTLYSPKVLVNYPGSGCSVPTWLKIVDWDVKPQHKQKSCNNPKYWKYSFICKNLIFADIHKSDRSPIQHPHEIFFQYRIHIRRYMHLDFKILQN